ncbi:unnamed protein product [Cuscuta campestris]|uniref:Uncharacterized protein n=1 Tax=Cuscuta campestris TaxID=132261 RepID=A0A484MUQ4_9ASTE|nr:unnamed protein product [Cuscuta campestris]
MLLNIRIVGCVYVNAAFGDSDNDNPDSYVCKVQTFWNALFVEYDDPVRSDDGGIAMSDSSCRIENLSSSEIEFPLLTRFKELAALSSSTSIKKKTEIELYLEEGLVCEQDNPFDGKMTSEANPLDLVVA